jgi:hypothetical protein
LREMTVIVHEVALLQPSTLAFTLHLQKTLHVYQLRDLSVKVVSFVLDLALDAPKGRVVMEDASCIEDFEPVAVEVGLYEAFEASTVELLLNLLKVFTPYDDQTQIRKLFTLMP